MVDRIMAIEDIYVLIPRTCKYVTLHDRRDFADVFSLKILRWGNIQNYTDGPNVITSNAL